jgi:hypothetical protein
VNLRRKIKKKTTTTTELKINQKIQTNRLSERRGTTYKIKLNVTTPTQLLPPLHFIGKLHTLASFHDGDILFHKCASTVAHEGEYVFRVAVVEVVKEDAAYTASFISVL